MFNAPRRRWENGRTVRWCAVAVLSHLDKLATEEAVAQGAQGDAHHHFSRLVAGARAALRAELEKRVAAQQSAEAAAAEVQEAEEEGSPATAPAPRLPRIDEAPPPSVSPKRALTKGDSSPSVICTFAAPEPSE